MWSEVKDFKRPEFHLELSSVYAGMEILYASGLWPHRNMEGLVDTFLNHNIGDITLIGVNGRSTSKIKYINFLPRRLMYNEMFKHSIGLMAFKKHWSHRYKSTNKAGEYAHAGLYVICTSSYDSIIESFGGNCDIFEDYTDLALRLKYYKENMEDLYRKRLQLLDFVRAHLLWDKYEKNILAAYQVC